MCAVLKKNDVVASASFTPSATARNNIIQAGLHEKDMFASISDSALASIASVFELSNDDSVIINSLNGFKQFAHITIYFQMATEFNKLLVFLLKYGYEYIERSFVEADLFEHLASTDLIDGLIGGVINMQVS